MSNSQLTSATAFSPNLEAIKLAAQMYNAAREGNKRALEAAVLEGMPPNLTNEKGDTLVSFLDTHRMSVCSGIPEIPDSRHTNTHIVRNSNYTVANWRSSCFRHTTATQTW